MNDFSQVVCPHCWALNCISTFRLINSPRCAKCKQLLFTGLPVNLSLANFTHFTQRNDIPIIVNFWDPWSDPCQTMSVIFKNVANVLEPHMRLAKVNFNIEKKIASRLQIRNIPCLVIFAHGQEIARVNDTMDSTSLIEWANKVNISALA